VYFQGTAFAQVVNCVCARRLWAKRLWARRRINTVDANHPSAEIILSIVVLAKTMNLQVVMTRTHIAVKDGLGSAIYFLNHIT